MSAFPGCAAQRLFDPKEPDRDRLTRQEAVVRHFEDQRDQAQFHSAMNDWQQGNAPRCRRSLQLILTRNPQHRQARLLLAELYLYDHQPEQAIETLTAGGDSDPNQAEALQDQDAAWQHTLGLAYEAMGDGVRTRELYRRAAELQPENELFAWSYEAAIDELELIAGDADCRSPADSAGNVESIAGDADRPPRAQRREPAPQARRTIKSAGQSPVLPAIHEQPIITDVATVSDVHARGAAANFDIGGPAVNVQTVVALIEVTEPEPASLGRESPITPDDAIVQAIAALEQGQSARAAEICREILREHSDAAALHRILGVAEYRQENYAAAQSAFQQALSLDNSTGLSYFLMGCTLAKLGQQAAADRHFARARVLDPRF